jgi:hypothetical protein
MNTNSQKSKNSQYIKVTSEITKPFEYKDFISDAERKYIDEYKPKVSDDYVIHTGMTNEEWMKKFEPVKLDNCQKCSLWEKCRIEEKTILTKDNLNRKMVDEISHHIDKEIVNSMLSSEKYKNLLSNK